MIETEVLIQTYALNRKQNDRGRLSQTDTNRQSTNRQDTDRHREALIKKDTNTDTEQRHRQNQTQPNIGRNTSDRHIRGLARTER